jgi:integrase
MWPAFHFKEKRAITLAEHRMIVAAEKNLERKAFYELAWHLGASQSDIAFLEAKDIDWENKIVSYERMKSGEIALVRFGEEVATVLRSRPEVGHLFPYLRTVRAGDRATEFKQRCRGLFIEGVSLHSYRYAWAERARKVGFPERSAQEALGHSSKAVHRAYAKKAEVIVPCLADYEAGRAEPKVVSFDQIPLVEGRAAATRSPAAR